jgi:hypothetical protein
VQIQSLTKAYPTMTLHKKTNTAEEYRVPIKLAISEQPLFIKV